MADWSNVGGAQLGENINFSDDEDRIRRAYKAGWRSPIGGCSQVALTGRSVPQLSLRAQVEGTGGKDERVLSAPVRCGSTGT